MRQASVAKRLRLKDAFVEGLVFKNGNLGVGWCEGDLSPAIPPAPPPMDPSTKSRVFQQLRKPDLIIEEEMAG